MELIVPTWFKYRQGKAEPAGEDTYRLTAPNLTDAFIHIHRTDNGRWSAVLRGAPDGPALAVTEPEYESVNEAWSAAFELYRNSLVT
jgi:hypothetical protein